MIYHLEDTKMQVQTQISFFDQVITKKMLENIEETYFSIKCDGEGSQGERFFLVGDSDEQIKVVPNITRLGEFIASYATAQAKSLVRNSKEDFFKEIDNLKSTYEQFFKV